MSDLHPNFNLHFHVFFFISEFQTVHGQILAINMAHLKKKWLVTRNETDGKNAFKDIIKINKGTQIT